MKGLRDRKTWKRTTTTFLKDNDTGDYLVE